MDFLHQKKFSCEITGHSMISFFEALTSEQAGSREVDSTFPDALREPVLRRVQFSTISRIDNLVDHVFEDLKQDFFPGEIVTVVLDTGEKYPGKVREKAKFPEVRNADGTIKHEAFSRYFVLLLNRADEEALVDDTHIVRDRKVFTKQMLRSYIKNTVTREAWSGAPWLVKPFIAEHYRINTNVPHHLQYSTKVAEKKAANSKKIDQDGMFNVWPAPRLPELRPNSKQGNRKSQQLSPDEQNYLEQQRWHEYQRAMEANPSFVQQDWIQDYAPGPYGPPPYGAGPPMGYFPVPNGYHQPNGHPPMMKEMPRPPPPPPVKYPIEDLDIAPVRDGTHRPALKFLSGTGKCEGSIPGVSDKAVGYLLETWNTLNVYSQVLHLDSFTFDDFVDAMQFSSDETDCELLVEIHCSLLKMLVNNENDQNGAMQISLPDLPSADSEDEDDSMEDASTLPTPTPEPEVPATRAKSRLSGLSKVENASDMQPRSRSHTADIKTHAAAEMFGDDGSYDWVQNLRKRSFLDGGWQMIMAGLLHQLAWRPRLTEQCDRILAHLVPLDADPIQETVRIQYSTMDINYRAEALHIICQLFMETKAVKAFLEECSNIMTQHRKIKIEHQRARKDAIAKLKSLNDDRRLLAPDLRTPTPIPELEEQVEGEKLNDMDDTIEDSEDDEVLNSRSLRRGNDRAAERKRKREEEDAKRKEKADAKQDKGSKEYQKVLKQIEKERERVDEAEEAIANVDVDLREADCPRTRCLGKDRFCNRYWWFERNAMPYGGLPDSSTANSDYANGRLWVQGPDDLEREGLIDVSEHEKGYYYHRFQLTPEERRTMEEGPTILYNAEKWGYYDTPEELDMLLGWLDTRGLRELKLKKELALHRDVIAKHMEKRKEYLSPRDESEEPPTRMSTRKQTYVSDAAHRCLKWNNSAAVYELGHKHSEAPPPPKVGRGRAKKVVEEESRTTRGTAKIVSRSGKALGRQGGRYDF
jgi:ATP-utilising chromatin assembly and remodelling N-terminal/Williams-Beuren syndrome DDT (WSD), D-TOX E motif/DDT domain/WSTF, HB1, Itc1p, MBD9 motif 1